LYSEILGVELGVKIGLFDEIFGFNLGVNSTELRGCIHGKNNQWNCQICLNSIQNDFCEHGYKDNFKGEIYEDEFQIVDEVKLLEDKK
jgi:hypothetical protein